MKKIFFYATLLTVAATSLTSCNNTNNNDVDSPKETALKAAMTPYVDNTVIATYKNLSDATIDLYNDCENIFEKFEAKTLTDADVQAGFPAYIEKIDPKHEHTEWFTDNVEQNIYNYLTSTDLPVEMSDDEYSDFMVWHHGLAVPAARNVKDKDVLRGRELFTQIGCAECHRPSWTTGADYIHQAAD